MSDPEIEWWEDENRFGAFRDKLKADPDAPGSGITLTDPNATSVR